MMRSFVRVGLALTLVTLLTVGAVPATLAAEDVTQGTVKVLTPYVGVAVEPGDTASFNLDVIAPDGVTVSLDVQGVPADWSSTIRAGGLTVDRVLIDEGLNHNLKLEVEVPETAADGRYPISVVAEAGSSSSTLELEIRVAQTVGGGVSLTTEFPALRGPSDVTFTFSLDLANDTGEEIQFGLQADGPAGWQIDARPSGQSRASTVTVAAGDSERITVEVDPPDFTPAGTYPVTVSASGSGESTSMELAVQITGNYELTLTTPDQRLNVDVQAGETTEMPLVVVNDGTAPLVDVSFSASPPRGWEVTFSPETIDRIEPGATADVTALVTPADDAITGDYRLTLRSSVAETSDSIEVRATVETSALWGLVGVGVIVVALGALALVFRRFGRR